MGKQNWDLGKAYRTATILNDIGEMSYCCAILEDEKYYCKRKIWNYSFKKKNWSAMGSFDLYLILEAEFIWSGEWVFTVFKHERHWNLRLIVSHLILMADFYQNQNINSPPKGAIISKYLCSKTIFVNTKMLIFVLCIK